MQHEEIHGCRGEKFHGGGSFTRAQKKRLGDLLVEEGIVTEAQLQDALKEQQGGHKGQKLGVTLVDLGYTTDHNIAKALQTQLGLNGIQLSTVRIPEEITRLVDESVLRKYMLIPYGFSERNANILQVAMCDPLDIPALDDIAIITGYRIEVAVTTPKDIAAAIDRYYGNAEAIKVAEQFTRQKQELYGVKEEETENDDVNQAPIVRLVNQIIDQAVRKRASDVHIEPMEDQVRIRFRVDGVLYEVMHHDMSLLSAIVARIKIMGDMDISEKRKPQDGRITRIVDRQEYDIRVSMLPTVYGEKVVLRLTLKKGLTRDKRKLGLTDDNLAKFDKILSHPHGIILVTGPTGSGKSTTLYTAISELNREGVNIITVEDPVEANVSGVNQVQVNPKADLTFASALRSILRQDPDIIMIGEIRDQETAEIAVKASITGHLVVSTLHTNSSAGTITRLEDMGIEPYLIADSVVGVIAQRLVRKLCPKCAVEISPSDLDLELLGKAKSSFEQIKIKTPGHTDCMQCGGTGYFGRIGVYEIMPVSYEMKQIISKKGTTAEIEAVALAEGMKTLRQETADYVLNGITSMEELKRITYEE